MLYNFKKIQSSFYEYNMKINLKAGLILQQDLTFILMKNNLKKNDLLWC